MAGKMPNWLSCCVTNDCLMSSSFQTPFHFRVRLRAIYRSVKFVEKHSLRISKVWLEIFTFLGQLQVSKVNHFA